MSICSDVFITREEAEKMAEDQLIQEQTILIKQAIKGMNRWELSGILNRDSELYYYNIEREDEDEEE